MDKTAWAKYPTAKRRQWARETPLAWILEYRPTILLPGKGYLELDPWPFQAEVLRCRDRFRAVNKPRQCGISTIFAAEAAWKATHVPGAQIIIASKDLDAAINFHKYIYNILYSAAKNDPDFPKFGKENTRETTFPDLGSRIVSLTASKETGRSFSATDWYFDEMAHAEYADDIFQAAAPTISQTGGNITALSTPKGRGNLFFRIFESPDDFGFTTFSYKWWHVPTYNPFYEQFMAAKTEREREKWIAKARTGRWYRENRPKYTDLSWAQEFEGSFDADQDSVFSTRQIEKTFWRNDWLEEGDDKLGICEVFQTSERQKGHSYATGVDVGRKRDATVIITYDITADPAVVVEFKYIPASYADYPLIERAVRQTQAKFDSEVMIDSTGSGDPVAQSLSDIAEPFTFTLNKKQNIIENVRLAMDNGALRMPKIKQLYHEHQKYVWQDKHIRQDTVMANALAVNLFYDPEDVFVGADPDWDYMELAA